MFEWRGLSVGWWLHHAHSARYAEYALWRLDTVETLRHSVFDSETMRTEMDVTTLHEAWHREAAIALELVIKAVMVSNNQGKPTEEVYKTFSHHDLPKLWAQAKLPPLCMHDNHTLEMLREVVEWSGQYPMPRSAQAVEKSWTRVREADTRYPQGSLTPKRPLIYIWADVIRLYEVAWTAVNGSKMPLTSRRIEVNRRPLALAARVEACRSRG